MADLRALELAAIATWPAFEEAWLGDWIIRATAGTTRRNNSVTPLGPAGVETQAAIDRAEEWFDARGIPPIFRLTALAPPELTPALEARGYRRADTTIVMTAELDGRADPDVTITDRPSDAWLDLLVGDGGRSPKHRGELCRQLLESPSSRFAEVIRSGRTVAIGSTAVAGHHSAIFNMLTLPSHRRQGIATRVLHALLATGAGLGATDSMLQVRDDNPAAIALYEREGFRPTYTYWYYQRPAGLS